MYFLISTLVVTVSLLEIHAKNLDPGPQVLNNTTKLSPQSSQKRYATKEIILYLTPSQIRALHEGQGWKNPQHISHDSDRNVNALTNSKAQLLGANHDQGDRLHQNFEQPRPLKAAPVEEPQSDHFLPIVPPPEYRHSDNYAFINFHPPNPQYMPKPVPFVPEVNEQALRDHKGLSTLIPQEFVNEKNHEENYHRDHLQEQWYRLLDQNRAQLKALATLSHYHELKSNEHKKDLLQYAPKYSDQKFALDNEHFINHHHQLQFEKQNSLAQAEAIANSLPVIVHKEINIKHSPVHVIKQVKVPVPTPVFIPIPEPFEVKVPHPYPVPLEIIKPVPVELDKPQSVNRNAFQSYFLERAIPFNIPEQKTRSLSSHSYL